MSNTESPESKHEKNESIRNCQFAFRCPMKWESLLQTKQEKIRYCSECDQSVYYCETDSEIADAIKKNECVAIFVTDGVDPSSDGMWLGEITTKYKLSE